MNQIKIVNKISRDDWTEFLRTQPNSNPFQTPEMLDVLRKTINYDFIFLAAKDSNDNIVGILLAQINKDYKGILGEFTARSIIFGGPLIKNNNSNVLDIIMKEYDHIAKKKAIYTQIRNFEKQDYRKKKFESHGYQYDDHLNVIIDLSQTEETIMSRISKSRRKKIRKGEKNNFAFFSSNGENLSEFYSLLTQSYKRIGIPIPKIDYFRNIVLQFNENCKVLYLKDNETNEIVVSTLGLIYKNTYIAYYMGRTDEKDVLKRNPIDFFNWKRLQWVKKYGINKFDWFGAGSPNKQSGVRDYKKTFGGELVNFGRYKKVHKPFLMKLGELLLIVWRKIK